MPNRLKNKDGIAAMTDRTEDDDEDAWMSFRHPRQRQLQASKERVATMTDKKKEPTEHTPGPWARSKDDWWVYSRANGEMIVDDIATENEFDYWLIAAAPEMLEALCAADQFITNGIELGYIRMPDANTPDSAHQTPGLVRAAIAKARHSFFTKG